MAYDREKGRKGRGGMKRTDEQLQELLLRELSKAGRLRRKQLSPLLLGDFDLPV